MNSAQLPAVGLVTVTYSPGDSLAALLDSIPGATARPVPVVLADNGSAATWDTARPPTPGWPSSIRPSTG